MIFNNVHLFITNKAPINGIFTFKNMQFAVCLYFSSDDANQNDYPFNDPLSMLPFSKPFLSENGHCLVDLSFYTDLTILNDPPRFCLHDSTQDYPISLKFESVATLQDFFEYLNQILTLENSVLQGFYHIYRFEPKICQCEYKDLQKIKNVQKEKYVRDEANDFDDMPSSHSKIISLITPSTKDVIGTSDNSNLNFNSKEELCEYLKHNAIKEEMKSTIWAKLIGIYPLTNINPKIRDSYFNIKKQWSLITISQVKRSSIYQDIFCSFTRYIELNTKSLFEIVNDPCVKQLVFNVLMSLCQFYFHFHKYHNELISMIKVLLWIFIKDVRNENDCIRYVIKTPGSELLLSSDDMEIILFWSMVCISEQGELRRLLNDKNKCNTNDLDDLFYLIHPNMYQIIHQRTKDKNCFRPLTELFKTMLSSILTFSKCSDIWIAAMSTTSFFDYIKYIISASVFYNFPTFVAKPKISGEIILQLSKQIISYLDHRFIEATAFLLFNKVKEIIQNNS